MGLNLNQLKPGDKIVFDPDPTKIKPEDLKIFKKILNSKKPYKVLKIVREGEKIEDSTIVLSKFQWIRLPIALFGKSDKSL